ncbi:MAG: hypothetical protein Q9181_000818 [Wetmoreana brouardii]
MASLLFTNLPPEIILRIFQYAEDFATVNALVRTSSIFHCVWLMNANSIAIAVLPRTIECYDEARGLAEAQEHVEALHSTYSGRGKSHREEVIVLVKRYLRNSDLITGFYESNVLPNAAYLKDNSVEHAKPPLLERKRFLRTLYCLKILAAVRETLDASCWVLPPIKKSDLVDISDMARWIRLRTPLEQRVKLGVESIVVGGHWLQKWLDSRLAAMQGSS